MMYVQSFGETRDCLPEEGNPGQDSLLQVMKRFLQRHFVGVSVTGSKGVLIPSHAPSEKHWWSPEDKRPLREPDACLFLEEILDENVCRRLTKQIEQCLAMAKTSPLCCRELLIPRGLSRRVARDVMRVSASEPCGLRGAAVYLHLESEGVSEKLGAIERDGAVVPTFELTLVFKQEGRGWPRLRELFSVGGCFVNPSWRRVLKLSPGFRLVKRKLYSSVGPIVEEC